MRQRAIGASGFIFSRGLSSIFDIQPQAAYPTFITVRVKQCRGRLREEDGKKKLRRDIGLKN